MKDDSDLEEISKHLSLLHGAVLDGNAVLCLKLLKDKRFVNAPDQYGNTPLHYAVMGGHLNIVRLLIDKGANIVAKNILGIIPTQLARENTEIYWLFDEKIEKQMPPLHQAVLYGALAECEMLLKHGADVNSVCPRAGTPLICAVVRGNLEICQFLIRNDADPHQAVNGKYALSIALELRRFEIVRLLQEKMREKRMPAMPPGRPAP